jgi:hypothetical protein
MTCACIHSEGISEIDKSVTAMFVEGQITDIRQPTWALHAKQNTENNGLYGEEKEANLIFVTKFYEY